MSTTVGELKEALKKVLPTLPHKMGVLAIEFSMERFRNEDWFDTSSVKWKPRKSKKDDKGRKLLVKSAVLKNSIRIVKESPQETVVGTDVKYAKVHNEGDQSTVTVKTHTRTVSVYQTSKSNKKKIQSGTKKVTVQSHSRKNNIPQRQYLGESQALTKRLVDMVGNEIYNSLNKK